MSWNNNVLCSFERVVVIVDLHLIFHDIPLHIIFILHFIAFGPAILHHQSKIYILSRRPDQRNVRIGYAVFHGECVIRGNQIVFPTHHVFYRFIHPAQFHTAYGKLFCHFLGLPVPDILPPFQGIVKRLFIVHTHIIKYAPALPGLFIYAVGIIAKYFVYFITVPRPDLDLNWSGSVAVSTCRIFRK